MDGILRSRTNWYEERISECPLCLQKNRLRPHGEWENPVCAKCKTPLPTGTRDRMAVLGFADMPYYFLWRDIDLEAQIRLHRVSSQPGRLAQCFTCCRQCPLDGGLHLNNRKFVCLRCLRLLLGKHWPEKYESQQDQYAKICGDHTQSLNRYSQGLISSKMLKLMTPFRRGSAIAVLTLAATLAGLHVHLECARHPLWFATAIAFVSLLISEWLINSQRSARACAVQRWLKSNPFPCKPKMKDFLDSDVELMDSDKQLLEVIHHWPGDPPFWITLRQGVIQRDRCRCQVTGCPSLLPLHVHHVQERFGGGSHEPENLITLCEYHHGTMEGSGHRRICSRALAQKSTPIRRQIRKDAYSTTDILENVISHYGVACPNCREQGLDVCVQKREKLVNVTCVSCGHREMFHWDLPEVNGPKIAEAFLVTQNHGRNGQTK